MVIKRAIAGAAAMTFARIVWMPCKIKFIQALDYSKGDMDMTYVTLTMPNGAMRAIPAQDVFLAQWQDNPRQIDIKLTDGTTYTLRGDQAGEAMIAIKAAHDVRIGPKEATA